MDNYHMWNNFVKLTSNRRLIGARRVPSAVCMVAVDLSTRKLVAPQA
jgi:hypothetical protein